MVSGFLMSLLPNEVTNTEAIIAHNNLSVNVFMPN
jgi:hypothetical protein